MPKTCCFLTSFFSGFGLDFGASWASNLEPSWLLWPQKTYEVAHFDVLKLNVFKNSVLEGSGLDFGGSRPRFQRVLGQIFRKCSTFSGLLW